MMQMFVMVYYAREATVKKSCKYGKYGSFEPLLFLFLLVVVGFFFWGGGGGGGVYTSSYEFATRETLVMVCASYVVTKNIAY